MAASLTIYLNLYDQYDTHIETTTATINNITLGGYDVEISSYIEKGVRVGESPVLNISPPNGKRLRIRSVTPTDCSCAIIKPSAAGAGESVSLQITPHANSYDLYLTIDLDFIDDANNPFKVKIDGDLVAPKIFTKTINGGFCQFHKGNTTPPSTGMIWFDTTNNKIKHYKNGTWTIFG